MTADSSDWCPFRVRLLALGKQFRGSKWGAETSAERFRTGLN
jgi:hypothetical protein